MQEHIRRAHPEYYIPKLPATKESFDLMINSPPHERPPTQDGLPTPLPTSHAHAHAHQPPHSEPAGLSPVFHFEHHAGLGSSGFEGYPTLGQHDGGYFTAGDSEASAIYNSMQAQTRSSDEYRRGSLIPAASAAAALAQLHYHRPDPDWGGDHNLGQVITFPILQMSPTITEADFLQNLYGAEQSNHDLKNHHHHSSHFHVDPALEEASYMPSSVTDLASGLYGHHSSYPTTSTSQDLPSLMPSSLTRSPGDGNDVTLPPLQRNMSRSHGRPRKSSLGQLARLAKHERRKSREVAKRSSGEGRKAFSAEPSAAALYGKRWEDLIDAATSATEEEDSRDLTPVSLNQYLRT